MSCVNKQLLFFNFTSMFILHQGIFPRRYGSHQQRPPPNLLVGPGEVVSLEKFEVPLAQNVSQVTLRWEKYMAGQTLQAGAERCPAKVIIHSFSWWWFFFCVVFFFI